MAQPKLSDDEKFRDTDEPPYKAVREAVIDVNDPGGAHDKGYTADPPAGGKGGMPPSPGTVSDPDHVNQAIPLKDDK